MITGCPKKLRAQRQAALRLAKAFRADDRAQALAADTSAELDEAYNQWAAGERTNRKEARAMLERCGMLERQPRCATSIVEDLREAAE